MGGGFSRADLRLGMPPLRHDNSTFTYLFRPGFEYGRAFIRATFSPFPLFADRAQAYAREHWAEQLIVTQVKSVMTINLYDTAVIDSHGRPKEVRTIECGLGRFWDELQADTSASQGDLIGQSFVHLAVNKVEEEELTGLHNRHFSPTIACCSRCGSGLSYTRCDVCKTHFYSRNWRPVPFPRVPT